MVPPLSITTESLPNEVSSNIIRALREDEDAPIPELRNILTDSLDRSGWTDRVRHLATELIRSGKTPTFPELFAEVKRRAQLVPPPEEKKSASKKELAANKKDANAASQNGGPNGQNSIVLSKEWTGGPDNLPDVSIPEKTKEEGIAFLRDAFENKICVRESGSDSE
jgi:hypothetical protein